MYQLHIMCFVYGLCVCRSCFVYGLYGVYVIFWIWVINVSFITMCCILYDLQTCCYFCIIFCFIFCIITFFELCYQTSPNTLFWSPLCWNREEDEHDWNFLILIWFVETEKKMKIENVSEIDWRDLRDSFFYFSFLYPDFN